MGAWLRARPGPGTGVPRLTGTGVPRPTGTGVAARRGGAATGVRRAGGTWSVGSSYTDSVVSSVGSITTRLSSGSRSPTVGSSAAPESVSSTSAAASDGGGSSPASTERCGGSECSAEAAVTRGARFGISRVPSVRSMSVSGPSDIAGSGQPRSRAQRRRFAPGIRSARSSQRCASS
ncbi:MAG: hypothetical protein R3F59_04080 [Myxococcota bacterium]